MRAVIYTRVSKDKRDQASVTQQEDEARLAAAALGWTIVEVYVDNDVSASRHARKARKNHPALLELLRSGDVDVLILWESSRGDRDNTRWSALLDLCRDRGVQIHVVNHRRTYDLNIPRDWKTLAEEGVSNAYASEETRERILRDVRANAVKGRPHGKLRYGYTRTYDDRGRFVAQVERPDQADLIRQCGRRVLAGETTYAIAQDLNARGIPAPAGGKWLPNQIKRILTDPAYVGMRVHRGQVIGPAVWPGILDEADYAACKARLEDARRNTIRDRSLKHLLSGSLRGACGGRTRVLKNRGYQTYVCHEDACTAVRTFRVEDFVTEVVIARLERPDILELLATKDEGSAVAAQAEADEKQRRLDGFVDAAANGDITPAALARIEARLLPEIEDARVRARTAPMPALIRKVAGPEARQRWEALEIGQKRELIDLLVELKLSPTVRGSRFSQWRLADSRWVGDEHTWGEIWADAPEASR